MTFPFPTYLPTLAPPELVGTPVGSTINNMATLNVTLPTGVVSGERLFMLVSGQAGGARTMTTPAGWTAVYNEAGTGGMRLVALLTRIADGSEGSSVATTYSGGTNLATLTWRVKGSAAHVEVGTRKPTSAMAYPTDPLTPSANGKLWFALLHRQAGGYGIAPTGWATATGETQGSNVACGMSWKAEDAPTQAPGNWTGFGATYQGTTALVAVW